MAVKSRSAMRRIRPPPETPAFETLTRSRGAYEAASRYRVSSTLRYQSAVVR